MSHYVSISVTDCKHLEEIRERLDNERDSQVDEAEIMPWIATLDSILAQAYEDGR